MTIEAENVTKGKSKKSPLQPERPATELALLGLLCEGASHGYELTRHFSEDTELAQVCQLEMSLLYALLKKLEKEGLVIGHEEPVSEHKTRHVVELSEEGKHLFEKWLSQPVKRTREMRLDFLVKLYFARRHGDTEAIALVQRQYDYNLSLLDHLKEERKKLQNQEGNIYKRWVLEFRIEQNEGSLRWLASCQKELAWE
jgi:DNA-binding PadR family transcriptional regulator